MRSAWIFIALFRSQAARLAQTPLGGETAISGAADDPAGGALAAAAAVAATSVAAATPARDARGAVGAAGSTQGRMDPCSLHWNAELGLGMGRGQSAGTGAAGSAPEESAAEPRRPLLYVGVLTRPGARDKRDALRRAVAAFSAFCRGCPVFLLSFSVASAQTNCLPRRETWFRHGHGEWVGVFFLGRPKGDPQLAAALEARQCVRGLRLTPLPVSAAQTCGIGQQQQRLRWSLTHAGRRGARFCLQEEAARECDIEFVREEEDYYSIAFKRAPPATALHPIPHPCVERQAPSAHSSESVQCSADRC